MGRRPCNGDDKEGGATGRPWSEIPHICAWVRLANGNDVLEKSWGEGRPWEEIGWARLVRNDGCVGPVGCHALTPLTPSPPHHRDKSRRATSSHSQRQASERPGSRQPPTLSTLLLSFIFSSLPLSLSSQLPSSKPTTTYQKTIIMAIDGVPVSITAEFKPELARSDVGSGSTTSLPHLPRSQPPPRLPRYSPLAIRR